MVDIRDTPEVLDQAPAIVPYNVFDAAPGRRRSKRSTASETLLRRAVRLSGWLPEPRRVFQELVAAAPRTEVIGLVLPLCGDGILSLDRHAAYRARRHGDHVLELSVLQPQHPVGDVFYARVVGDDDGPAALLPGGVANPTAYGAFRSPSKEPKSLAKRLIAVGYVSGKRSITPAAAPL